MPAASSMIVCISSRMAEIRSVPDSPPMTSCSMRRTSSAAWASIACGAALAEEAYSAAARPARAPNTRHSGSELEPSRFAPLMLTHAVSPAAYRPSSGVAPSMSVWTPPIM